MPGTDPAAWPVYNAPYPRVPPPPRVHNPKPYGGNGYGQPGRTYTRRSPSPDWELPSADTFPPRKSVPAVSVPAPPAVSASQSAPSPAAAPPAQPTSSTGSDGGWDPPGAPYPAPTETRSIPPPDAAPPSPARFYRPEDEWDWDPPTPSAPANVHQSDVASTHIRNSSDVQPDPTPSDDGCAQSPPPVDSDDTASTDTSSEVTVVRAPQSSESGAIKERIGHLNALVLSGVATPDEESELYQLGLQLERLEGRIPRADAPVRVTLASGWVVTEERHPPPAPSGLAHRFNRERPRPSADNTFQVAHSTLSASRVPTQSQAQRRLTPPRDDGPAAAPVARPSTPTSTATYVAVTAILANLRRVITTDGRVGSTERHAIRLLVAELGATLVALLDAVLEETAAP